MSYALRPALPADFADLAILFQASIEELSLDAYDDAQEDGEPVGFAAMRDNRIIENVHVHPDMAFMGVGSQLVDALERLAAARGTKTMSVAATDNATAFFERIGYVAVRRSTLSAGGQWLPSTVMEKTLGGEGDLA
jgi:putative acetyltransferase